MSREQGLALAASAAFLLIFVAALSFFVAAVEKRQAHRRHAPRIEAPRRMALVAEDFTDDEATDDLTAYACPGCGRNAGHDDDCYQQRGQRRAKEIQIPREGETK